MVRHYNHGMETTLYEEQYSANRPIEHMKNRLTLDLEELKNIGKSRQGNSILNTPDVNKFTLATPDLEAIVYQNGALMTTNPSPVEYPTSNPTVEQEIYALGFQEALQALRQGDTSGSICTDDHNIHQFNAIIKDEPQTVPSASSTPPPMSPIDMKDQETLKLERKRLRNREAASKCRKKKLEKIAKLELRVADLKHENSDLASKVHKLKEHVFKLKQQVIEHVNSGCSIDQTFC